jgi:O-antigen/teichoic acid export membrane protein
MAQGKGQLLDKIPGAMNTILFPRISNMAKNEDGVYLAAFAFRVILVILLLAGVCALVFICPAVVILYGSAYLPLVKPFMIMIPGIVLMGAASVLNQYFTGIGRADLIAKISLAPLCCQLLLAFILIPALGLTGAALSILLTMAIDAAIRIIIFVKINRLRWIQNLLPGRADLLIVYGFASSFFREKIFKARTILTCI